MTATDRLNAMQQRCDAATEGPWEKRLTAGREAWPLVGPSDAAPIFDGIGPRTSREADARFIAHARTDLPATIAALRAVLKVHAPLWTPSRGHYCQECGTPLTDDAPDCSTVRVITEALT